MNTCVRTLVIEVSVKNSLISIRKATSFDYPAILDVLSVWNMHHIPSLEMPELDVNCCFVAVSNSKIVGVSGYLIKDNKEAETTLLAVLPPFLGTGVGKELQLARMRVVYSLGISTLITGSDSLESIAWYTRNFGYRPIGYLKKLISFGDPNIDTWTLLQTNLLSFFESKSSKDSYRNCYINSNDPPPLSDYPPLIINVCLTGMVPSQEFTPYVPSQPEEIIQQAIDVYKLGASIVHLHARGKDGLPTCDPLIFEKIILGIRLECPDLICCVSTSGRGGASFQDRSSVLHLSGSSKPDMASLTLSSMNFSSGPSINSPATIQLLAQLMKEKGIKPELEVFDAGMINYARYLERHTIIEGVKYFNLILGGLSSAPATIHTISHLVKDLPPSSLWSVAGIGSFQLPMNNISICAGGHVRVGIEDNMYLDHHRTTFASNTDLVRRVVTLTSFIGRSIATPSYTRRLLELPVFI